MSEVKIVRVELNPFRQLQVKFDGCDRWKDFNELRDGEWQGPITPNEATE